MFVSQLRSAFWRLIILQQQLVGCFFKVKLLALVVAAHFRLFSVRSRAGCIFQYQSPFPPNSHVFVPTSNWADMNYTIVRSVLVKLKWHRFQYIISGNIKSESFIKPDGFFEPDKTWFRNNFFPKLKIPWIICNFLKCQFLSRFWEVLVDQYQLARLFQRVASRTFGKISFDTWFKYCSRPKSHLDGKNSFHSSPVLCWLLPEQASPYYYYCFCLPGSDSNGKIIKR